MAKKLEMKFKKLTPWQLMDKGDGNKLILESDTVHEYSSIKIEKGCSISVEPWSSNSSHRQYIINPYELTQLISHWYSHYIPPTYSMDIQQLILQFLSSAKSISFGGRGGKLYIKCSGDIIIEKGASIHVNHCGYKSGSYYTAGESCSGLGRAYKTNASNMGGGGAGIDCGGGGGAGYGTKGGDGYRNDKTEQDMIGLGGEIYGDKYLRELHLGSGGGGAQCNVGGDGGGAIYIECNRLVNYGLITSNGGDAMDGAGAGSGGSIHLVIHDSIIMDNQSSLIQAKGGYGGKWGLYANGGHGRIRIDINQKFHQQIDGIIKLKRINPPPFVCAKLNNQ